jgi:O-methyltransferase involved in polyketide biosynthesis
VQTGSQSASWDALARTALTPFWSRVADAGSAEPILGDLAAAALVPQVARRYGRVEVPDTVRIGSCLRDLSIDEWLQLLAAGGCIDVVLELGVGLDTRRSRLSSVPLHFVEVDRAPIIAARDEWIPRSRTTRMAADALDIARWSMAVPTGGRIAVVLQGVLPYQRPAAVAAFFAALAVRHPGAYLIFDSVSPLSARLANRGSVRAGGRPRYEWSTWRDGGLAGPRRRWVVLDQRGFMDLPRELTRTFPATQRVVYSLPVLRRSYRLTLARSRKR